MQSWLKRAEMARGSGDATGRRYALLSAKLNLQQFGEILDQPAQRPVIQHHFSNFAETGSG